MRDVFIRCLILALNHHGKGDLGIWVIANWNKQITGNGDFVFDEGPDGVNITLQEAVV